MKESIVGTGLTKRVQRTISSKDSDAAQQMRKITQRKHWGYDGAARGTVENLVKTLKGRGLPYLNKTIVIEGDGWRYLRDGESAFDAAPASTLSKYFKDKFGYQSFEEYAGRIIETSHLAFDEQNIPAAIELGYLMRELGFKELHEADAIHGRKFPRRSSDQTKKKRKSSRSSVALRKQVLGMARRFLNMGGFRHANRRPNISALASKCEETANIGYESARRIIRNAINLGNLK